MSPIVSICCITYNHEKYITKALESFFSQITTFEYEVVISNDCSKDNTQMCIDEYKTRFGERIRDVSPEKNLGVILNFYNTLKQCSGKYIAYCEGDDYWIDRNKLQVQVDYLEQNPDYGLCYTLSRKVIDGNEKKYVLFGCDCCDFKSIMQSDRIPTQTILFRKDLFLKYYEEIEPDRKNWMMGDLPLVLWFSINSKIKFLNRQTSVYRILKESANHHRSFEKGRLFLQSEYEVKCFFNDKYGLQISNDELRKRYEYSLIMKSIVIDDYKEFLSLYSLYVTKDLKRKIFKLMSLNKFFFKVIRCLILSRNY